MFGIFGSKKKAAESEPEHPKRYRYVNDEEFNERAKEAMGEQLFNVCMALDSFPEVPEAAKWLISRELLDSAGKNRSELLKQMSRLNPERQRRLNEIAQTGGWEDYARKRADGMFRQNDRAVMLGMTDIEPGDESLFWHAGENHLVTVAPPGAGKNQGHIIPNLLLYQGPAVVLDVKGENFEWTSARRSLYGKVYKWAPFDEVSHSYNPIDNVYGWSDANLLATMMIPPGERSTFWDSRARALIAAIVMWTREKADLDHRNMREAASLLWGSKEGILLMAEEMARSEDRITRENGQALSAIPEDTLGGIIETAKEAMEIWRDPAIEKVTYYTDWEAGNLRWQAATAWRRHLRELEEGKAAGRPEPPPLSGLWCDTIYLSVPSTHMATYAPVLRVILAQHIQGLTEDPAESDYKVSEMPAPVLMMLDEVATLGYMEPLERAMAVVRSSGVRIWLFLQDLGQLRAHYPKQWEAMLASCEVQAFMNINNLDTAKYVSERIGHSRNVITGDTGLFVRPEDLMGPDYEDQGIIFLRNRKPFRFRKVLVYQRDDYLQCKGKLKRLRFSSDDEAGRDRPEPPGNDNEDDD
jgi:type IV secretion system protein VirD4